MRYVKQYQACHSPAHHQELCIMQHTRTLTLLIIAALTALTACNAQTNSKHMQAKPKKRNSLLPTTWPHACLFHKAISA